MPKLFSYVVDHDLGFAPNPFGGFCTLAKWVVSYHCVDFLDWAASTFSIISSIFVP